MHRFLYLYGLTQCLSMSTNKMMLFFCINKVRAKFIVMKQFVCTHYFNSTSASLADPIVPVSACLLTVYDPLC